MRGIPCSVLDLLKKKVLLNLSRWADVDFGKEKHCIVCSRIALMCYSIKIVLPVLDSELAFCHINVAIALLIMYSNMLIEGLP